MLKKKLTISEELKKELIQKAQEMLNKKYSVLQICNELGITKNIFYSELGLKGVLRPEKRIYIKKVKEKNKELDLKNVDLFPDGRLFGEMRDPKNSKTILVITDDHELIKSILRKYE